MHRAAMTSRTSSARSTILLSTCAIAIATALAIPSAGCGSAGASLRIQPIAGDRDATPRRLESLARTFESSFGCTEADTIEIVGIVPGVYSATGCNASRDYILGCRPGPYRGQICDWQPIVGVTQQAGADMSCAPDALDVQPGAPGQRVVEGCGFRAVYQLQCAGQCGWILASRIEQSTPGGAAQGPHTY
jgi:hypothetical protein